MIFAEKEVSMEVVAVGGTLLGSISDFCRRTGMAESTFGRRAVNDGKFVARLRDGARVTPGDAAARQPLHARSTACPAAATRRPSCCR